MSAAKPGKVKEKSSLDFSHLAKGVTEASQPLPASKLPKGLYLVATPIGNLGDITLRALTTLQAVDRVACEDTRVSGGLLARYGIKKPLMPYHDHNAERMRPAILAKLAEGETIALISDAGVPLIADPGYKLASLAREAGHQVTVVPGANAALTALMGSALPAERFYFAGFLPAKSTARKKAIAALKTIDATLIFYEAPQRILATLSDLASILGAERKAAAARELTKLFEETLTASLGELVAHFTQTPPRGEFVLLTGPPLAQNAVPLSATVDEIIKAHLKTHSLRDAVMLATAETGGKKAEIYLRALELKGQQEP